MKTKSTNFNFNKKPVKSIKISENKNKKINKMCIPKLL